MKYFATRENRFYYFIALALITVFGYMALNHNPVFAPRRLPFTRYDHAVPLMPLWMWIYVTMYPMMILAYSFLKDIKTLNKAMLAFFLLQIAAFTVFLLFPTTFPREEFPLPLDVDPATLFLFQFIHGADLPNNCFPSLHVGNCFICSFFLLGENRKKAIAWIIWSALVAFSTMAVKQHYFADVVLGLSLALACYWIVFYLIKFEE